MLINGLFMLSLLLFIYLFIYLFILFIYLSNRQFNDSLNER